MNKFVKNVALYVLLIIIAVSIFNTFVHPQEKHSEITYSDFISQVEKKNVDSVTMTNNSISGKLKDGSEFATYAPDNDAQLLPKLSEGGVIITAKPPEQPSWWMNLLSSLLPIIILVGVWFWIMNQTQGGGGRVMSFGKSRAKMTAEGQVHVNFSDVAGEDEAKEELSEVVARHGEHLFTDALLHATIKGMEGDTRITVAEALLQDIQYATHQKYAVPD